MHLNILYYILKNTIKSMNKFKSHKVVNHVFINNLNFQMVYKSYNKNKTLYILYFKNHKSV